MSLKPLLPKIVAGLFLWLFFFLYQPVSAYQSPDAAITFTGSKLPVPPLQNQPWTPPASKLPESFVSATNWLFEQGMADPRGCEYREIEVTVGNVWGEYGPVKAHGWVLPQDPTTEKTRQRFAVCWNGLVYPVKRIGKKLALQNDLRKPIKKQVEVYLAYIRKNPNSSYWKEFSLDEKYNVAQQEPSLVWCSLLLRLGEPELANQVWDVIQTPMSVEENNHSTARYPFFPLVFQCIWPMFDRGLSAHMRGDDQLALSDFRQAILVNSHFEIEAARRGIPRPIRPGRRDEKLEPYIDSFQILPQLLADQERRALERTLNTPCKRAIEAGRNAFSDQTAWISALIHDLDTIQARQYTQPGWVQFIDQPEAQALIAEGEAAIEALIQTIETDTRLTRSVGYYRDFRPYRYVVSVQEVAYAIVCIFFKKSFGQDYVLRSPKSQRYRTLLTDLRAFWEQYQKSQVPDAGSQPGPEPEKEPTEENRNFNPNPKVFRPEPANLQPRACEFSAPSPEPNVFSPEPDVFSVSGFNKSWLNQLDHFQAIFPIGVIAGLGFGNRIAQSTIQPVGSPI